MTALDPQSSGRPTRIGVREVRADALHRVLLRRRVSRIENVTGLSELWNWPRMQVEVALGDLVHDGRIEEGPQGELIVHKAAT